MKRPGIIDVHSHSFFAFWHAALIEAGHVRDGHALISNSPLPTWTVDETLRMMDAHGIEVSVLSIPNASPLLKGPKAASLARMANEEFARIIDRHPDRFGAFALLPQHDFDAVIEESIYALDVLKLDGIGTSSHINGTYLGESVLDPWLSELHRREAPLFVHPGASPWFAQSGLGLHASLLEFMFDTTRSLTNFVLSGQKQRYPGIKVISTHGGGTIPYLVHRLQLLEPVFGAGAGRPTLSADDVRKGFASFYFDLTASINPASLAALLDLVPPSQLLMGFDFPMMPERYIAPAIEGLMKSDTVSDTDRSLICHDNALAVFPRLEERLRRAK